MSIRVKSVAYQGTGDTSPDGYLDKIVKSIPSQVIAFYTAAIVALRGTATTTGEATTGDAAASNPRLWIAFVIGLILTPVLTWRQTTEPNKPPAYLQIAIATVSFIVWAFATGGPFENLGFWDPGIATVVLAGYTILIGVVPQN